IRRITSPPRSRSRSSTTGRTRVWELCSPPHWSSAPNRSGSAASRSRCDPTTKAPSDSSTGSPMIPNASPSTATSPSSPSPWPDHPASRRSGEDPGRMLEALLQYGDPARGEDPVDRSVVHRQGQAHHLAGDDRAVLHDRFVADGPDGQDRCLGRVDDRGELLDAVHPEVGDRDRPALEIVLPELPV